MLAGSLPAALNCHCVTPDGLVAKLLPNVGRHFVHAKLQHFVDDATALRWLKLPPGEHIQGVEESVSTSCPSP
jgi:hypothetical protein